MAPSNYEWNWNSLVANATYDQEVFNYVYSVAPSNYIWNWDRIINKALENENTDLANYLIKTKK